MTVFITIRRNKIPLITKKNTPQKNHVIFGTMKRTGIILILFAIYCAAGFAEENASAEFNYRITSGGFWSCGQDFSGGFGEFGLNLLPVEKNFVLRDCIFLQGEGGTLRKSSAGHPDALKYNALFAGDKLIIGGRMNATDFIIRGYGFCSGAFGLFGCSEHNFLDQPFMVNLTFGGGFEFQYHKRSAFVIEYGGLNRILAGTDLTFFEDYSKSSASLTIGFRSIH